MQVTEHALKIQIQKRHHDKHEQATPQNGIKEGNQGKWLMVGGASRCLWQSRWQLSYCASSPVPTCPTPLSTLPIHSDAIWAGSAPLGQESIWSSGATYQHRLVATPAQRQPATHLPTHNCHPTTQMPKLSRS